MNVEHLEAYLPPITQFLETHFREGIEGECVSHEVSAENVRNGEDNIRSFAIDFTYQLSGKVPYTHYSWRYQRALDLERLFIPDTGLYSEQMGYFHKRRLSGVPIVPPFIHPYEFQAGLRLDGAIGIVLTRMLIWPLHRIKGGIIKGEYPNQFRGKVTLKDIIEIITASRAEDRGRIEDILEDTKRDKARLTLQKKAIDAHIEEIDRYEVDQKRLLAQKEVGYEGLVEIARHLPRIPQT